MQRQFRAPLFKALEVDASAIAEEFDYLSDEDVLEVVEVFEGYLADNDVWDILRDIALDIADRNGRFGIDPKEDGNEG